MVAESIRAMAALQMQEPEAGDRDKKKKEKTDTEKNSEDTKPEKAGRKGTESSGKKEVAVEDIRAVLAQKSQDGKTKEIKALLGKFGAVKLSAVKPENYPALLQEAKVL